MPMEINNRKWRANGREESGRHLNKNVAPNYGRWINGR